MRAIVRTTKNGYRLKILDSEGDTREYVFENQCNDYGTQAEDDLADTEAFARLLRHLDSEFSPGDISRYSPGRIHIEVKPGDKAIVSTPEGEVITAEEVESVVPAEPISPTCENCKYSGVDVFDEPCHSRCRFHQGVFSNFTPKSNTADTSESTKPIPHYSEDPDCKLCKYAKNAASDTPCRSCSSLFCGSGITNNFESGVKDE